MPVSTEKPHILKQLINLFNAPFGAALEVIHSSDRSLRGTLDLWRINYFLLVTLHLRCDQPFRAARQLTHCRPADYWKILPHSPIECGCKPRKPFLTNSFLIHTAVWHYPCLDRAVGRRKSATYFRQWAGDSAHRRLNWVDILVQTSTWHSGTRALALVILTSRVRRALVTVLPAQLKLPQKFYWLATGEPIF